jgi:chemotaxis protein methyltransferase CheR
MTANLAELELTDAHFRKVRETVYRISRINLHEGKEGLVKMRLTRRIRELGLESFDAYLEHVASDASGREVAEMVDALTTNKTSFFREAQHFDFLCEEVLPALVAAGRPVNLWSAGCSTGEEPYTLAMLLAEELPEGAAAEARILATDISARVLTQARGGIYSPDRAEEIPQALRRKYLAPAGGAGVGYQVAARLRERVRFARLNLMEEWPMRGKFQVIFCRNVMIYFDRPTQERLVQRFWEQLMPGGHLFVGHSESLSSLEHRFRYVRPAIYLKP